MHLEIYRDAIKPCFTLDSPPECLNYAPTPPHDWISIVPTLRVGMQTRTLSVLTIASKPRNDGY